MPTSLTDNESVTIIQDGNVVEVVQEEDEVTIVANIDTEGIRDYNRLANKPSINGYVLSGDMVITDADLRPVLVKDESGEYSTISQYFNAHRNGLIYSIKIPKYASNDGTVCVKADANTGMVCEPSTNLEVGRDDYAALKDGPFLIIDGCNGTVDADGLPHVYAISGDTTFKKDGSNGDVWVAAPVLWWKFDDTTDNDYVIVSISDSFHTGFDVQPGAKLPDGSLRPYMLYAKYPGVMVDSAYMSASGYPVKGFESYNTLVDKCALRGDGFAPSTHADDWYASTMLYMMYAHKSSQDIYGGCTNYNIQVFASVAEQNTKRIILTNANAANLIVGSSVSIGSMDGDATKSKDRSSTYTRDVVSIARITSIEDYDEDNKAVTLDVDEPFDTVANTTLLSTMAWFTGCCDNVLGRNGSIATPTSMNYPFKVQGIELMHGYYEVLGNVATYIYVDQGDEQKCDVYICYDSHDGLKNTSNYTNTEVSLGCKEAGGWVYQEDIANAGGLYVGVGTQATTSKGTGDGTYSNTKAASTGVFHAFCSRGRLTSGASFGLRCVNATNGLGSSAWSYAGRPSALGRSAA